MRLTTRRSLLDQLLTDSRLYTRSKHYEQLLNFVVRLRNFAPFNAMLLQVQKPGMRYAASAHDWQARFGRWPVEGARPLLILWPFGPVAPVYDVMDTEGAELPRDVGAFPAQGSITPEELASFAPLMSKKNIEWRWVDAGDQRAGSIRGEPGSRELGTFLTKQEAMDRVEQEFEQAPGPPCRVLVKDGQKVVEATMARQELPAGDSHAEE